MLGTVLIVGLVVLALILYAVYRDDKGRYEYVKETRRVWKRFERNPDSPFGISSVYEDITVNVLKENPNGDYYNNGRKVK